MSIFDLLSLFGGLAMFLYGMRLMSKGLKEGSTGTLKKIMEKVTNNVFMSFLLGVFVTALIQSSTATIVITSGLVAANVISLKQSVGIAVGANVGTTVTGQIIRLMDLNTTSTAWLQIFKPSSLAPIALIVGIIFVMFVNDAKSNSIGEICMGFGILFVGLMNMTSAVSALNESGIFEGLFMLLSDNPIIGYLIGAGISFILQSSSATIGILQAFSVSGLLYFKSVYAVIVGIYLGDCVTTAIVCSIGARADAKRVGVVNVLFNLCETIIIFTVVTILKSLGVLDFVWNQVANSSLIANTHTIFNISCAIILLPFISKFEIIARKIVKDDKDQISKYADIVSGLDSKFYVTPAIALSRSYSCLVKVFEIARNNIELSLSLINKYDEKIFREINANEDDIDELTDKVSQYLVDMNHVISEDEHLRINAQYYNVAGEFERLGDHAINIAEYAQSLSNSNISFSKEAKEEMKVLKELIDQILGYAKDAFEKRDLEAADHIEPLEEVVDDMTAVLKNNHTDRLSAGECNIISGTVFLNLLSDIERISDICSNIGIATVSRLKPQFANQMHNYMSLLHQGNNPKFNEEYENAHIYYFEKLDKIKKGM